METFSRNGAIKAGHHLLSDISISQLAACDMWVAKLFGFGHGFKGNPPNPPLFCAFKDFYTFIGKKVCFLAGTQNNQ